ncbi:MAG: hypothetical protein U0800_18430 [Isosphaeraceae bacterium]
MPFFDQGVRPEQGRLHHLLHLFRQGGGMGLVRATYIQTTSTAGVHGSITLSNKSGTVR